MRAQHNSTNTEVGLPVIKFRI